MATNEENEDKQQQQEDEEFEVVVEGDEPAGKQQEADERVEDEEEEGERRARSGGDRRAEEGDENLTPEQKAKRERRREERKLRKERQEARDRKLLELESTVQELRSQLGSTAQSMRHGEYQRVNAALNSAVSQMHEAKRLMDEAKAAENWSAAFDAQEAFFEAQARANQLNVLKTRFEQANDGEDDGESRRPAKPDPEIVRRASSWRSKNEWFDPRGGDADSKIAKAIDDQLYDDGFDPRTPAYWKELDKRIAKQLPHRATRENAGDLDDDLDDESSPTSGSGRERAPSGKRVVRVSKERIEALKEAGIDVTDRKAMAPYLRQFAKWDKENADLLRGQ